jgi:hypothetical protein
MWVSKSLTLRQLHLQVFKYLKHVLGEWLDYKNKDSDKKNTELG